MTEAGARYSDEHRDYEASVRSSLGDLVTAGDGLARAASLTPGVLSGLAEPGFLTTSFSEEHGGLGQHDIRFGVALRRECARIGAVGLGIALAELTDVCLPLLGRLAGAEHHEAWLEQIGKGEVLVSLVGLEGTLKATSHGAGWQLQGTSAAAINAPAAHLHLVAAQQDGSWVIVLVPADAAGVSTAPPLDLIGPAGLHMAPVTYDNTPVAADAVLAKGADARSLVEVATSRQDLMLAVGACADAHRVLSWTEEYVQTRMAFGTALADFQNTRLVLGDAHGRLSAADVVVEDCLDHVADGSSVTSDTAAARRTAMAALIFAADIGVQLHGGYGFMAEYPISTAYLAAGGMRLLGAHGETALRELSLPVGSHARSSTPAP